MEQNDLRRDLFNTLMQVPHRELTPLAGIYRQALEQDPFFAGKFLGWTIENSAIRDQQEAAIIALLQSNDPEYRDAGEIYLAGSEVTPSEPNNIPSLEPYRVFRVLHHIATSSTPKVARRLFKCSNGSFGLLPRYLKLLELQPARFDGVVLRNRKAMKWGYKYSHLKPSARAQAILFDDTPPEGSQLAVLKKIASTRDNHERAKLIMDNKIPFKVAQGLLDKFDAVTAIALIDVMSPTEALNSRAMVERSGILTMPEVKEAYLKKVAKATKSAASASHRQSVKGQDAEVEQAVAQAKSSAIAAQKKIEQPLALLVDCSGSMEQAISVAREFAVRISSLLAEGTPRKIVIFSDYAAELPISDWTPQGIEKAFSRLRAGGGTNMTDAILYLVKNKFETFQVTFITDGQEMAGDVTTYMSQPGLKDMVVNVIGVGRYMDRFHQRLEQVGIRTNVFKHSGRHQDYYIFDQVAALLGGPKPLSPVERVLEYQMPVKR